MVHKWNCDKIQLMGEQYIRYGGFGGVFKSGDPIEQAKLIKYSDLVANSIMIHNIVDLTEVLTSMAEENYTIAKELLAGLSPFIMDQIRRFGRYDVDISNYPPNLIFAGIPLSCER